MSVHKLWGGSVAFTQKGQPDRAVSTGRAEPREISPSGQAGPGAGAKPASPAQVLLDAVDGMRLTCEKMLQSVAETKVRPKQEPQLTPVIHGAMEAAQGAVEALARYLLEEELIFPLFGGPPVEGGLLTFSLANVRVTQVLSLEYG